MNAIKFCNIKFVPVGGVVCIIDSFWNDTDKSVVILLYLCAGHWSILWNWDNFKLSKMIQTLVASL